MASHSLTGPLESRLLPADVSAWLESNLGLDLGEGPNPGTHGFRALPPIAGIMRRAALMEDGFEYPIANIALPNAPIALPGAI